MTFKAGWAFESGTVEGWEVISGNPLTASATNPRTGAYALRPAPGSTVYAPIGEGLDDPIGQWCNRQETYRDGLRFGFLFSGTWVAYVQFNSLGNPTLFYNGGAASVGPLAEFVYALDAYHTIEIEMTTIGAAGDIYLRIDGDILILAENVDTRAGGGAITEVNQVGIFTPFTAVCDVDDVVVFDHAGSVNNSWPDGVAGYPTEAESDGTYEEWDASTGTDHAALINEVPVTSTGYIQTGVASEQDSFNMEDVTGLISGAYDIAAFQVVLLGDEPNGPSGRTVDTFIIVDAIDHLDGKDHELTATTAFYPGKLWETNPETALAWTPGDLDDIEIGVASGA